MIVDGRRFIDRGFVRQAIGPRFLSWPAAWRLRIAAWNDDGSYVEQELVPGTLHASLGLEWDHYGYSVDARSWEGS